MLTEIYIENLAVIKQASIPFCSKFNVFTGETGAGKSILIGGINAILGKRVSKEIVRSGAEKAVITGLFTGLSETTKEKLSEFGVDFSDDEITLTREISADGGSIARINGKTSAVSLLKEIGATLVDIHGQHDNRLLLYPEKHIEIVDDFGEIYDDISDYKSTFKAVQNISREIKKLRLSEENRTDRILQLEKIIAEIGELKLSDEDEDATVESEFMLLYNSAEISEILETACDTFAGNDNNLGFVLEVDFIRQKLLKYSSFYGKFDEISKRLSDLKLEITDINDELLQINSSIDFDENRYKFLEERRDNLTIIKKKYGPKLSDVIAFEQSSQAELSVLLSSDNDVEQLVLEKNKLLSELTDKAKLLSDRRVKSAEKLAEKISAELKFLDMPNVRFAFSHSVGKLTANGMDSFEMVISANLGEEPKPIAKIASGGELSRIMLAIKNVTAQKEEIPTLIFDEIDTGVSGRAAQKIGVKLAEISKLRQVICVTHLSQIAVMAENHLLIEKNTADGKTFTNVKKLTEDERVFEIARIQCGDNITETAMENAREQLQIKDKIYKES